MGEMKAEYPFLPAGATVRTVSKLTEEVRTLLERGFDSVWVEGEISNVSRPGSGHIYLSLREGDAVIQAVMYRGQVLRLPAGFEPSEGQAVLAFGRISVYAPRGAYQLVIERMHPKGIGAAEQALRQLKEKLFRLGYFDPKRKRRLPKFPGALCLISSPSGAAVRDMIELLRRRWPSAHVFIQPTRVQGDGSADEIAAAINRVNRWNAKKSIRVDAILLGRGGGSTEDLAAFNEEVVARAVFQSQIPVVSAVGHEIDVTIADLVADVRAATPSHAIEISTPDRREMMASVDGFGGRLAQSVQRRFVLAQRRIQELSGRLAVRRPLARVRELERRLDEQSERLTRAVRARIVRGQREVVAASARLESLSPLNVLARGYSLTQTESDRALVRAAEQVSAGDRIVTTVKRGRIVSRVESTEPIPERQG